MKGGKFGGLFMGVGIIDFGSLYGLFPKILWKIENLFTVKNGEPTELYLVLMRIGGVFFIICSVGMIIYLIIK